MTTKARIVSTLALALFAGIALWVTLMEASPGLAPLTPGGSPAVVSYQGQVTEECSPFDGDGFFKFAVVDTDGATSYWSNDGTSESGSEPENGVRLPVEDGLFHVLDRQVVGGHFQGIEPHAHGVTAFTPDEHVAHTRQPLEPFLEDAVGVVGYLECAVLIAGDGQPDDGLGVDVDLGHDGVLGLAGQGAAHAGDAVTDIVGGLVNIPVQFEFDGDDRPLLATAAGDGLDRFAVSYTHLTLPTNVQQCRSRWSPYH